MSGFCGWVTSAPGTSLPETIDKMAAALPAYGTRLSHGAQSEACGLATRSRTSMGDWFQDDRVWATLEGYPNWSDPDLAAFARDRGQAAALARAYAEHGRGLLDRLHGPVSFAIVDLRNRSALMAIDRAGIQTLCYAETPSGLVFGSTADSVRAHPAVTSTIHPQSIYDFFYFVDRIPAPNTIYQEQKKLVPGQFLSFDDGKTEVGFYWRMPYREGVQGDPQALKAELLERLRDAVASAVVESGETALGAFLSGGLDSSTVVALMSERLSAPLKTFTIAFEDPRFDESSYARLVADRFGTEHDSFVLQPDEVESAVVEIAQAYDEPFANSSAVPAFICARRARQAGVEVLVAGDGGDELFAGNSRYLEDQVFDHYARIPSRLRRALLEPLIAELPGKDQFALVRKAKKYIQLASMSVAERLVRNNIFLHQDYRQIFAPEAADKIDPRAPVRLCEGMYEEPCSREKLHRMFYVDQRLTLADSDLRKVGRMCDMANVEVRYPFLDETLMEFSARIPTGYLMKGKRLRAFYKDAMSGALPSETLTKTKHGFGLPYAGFVQHDKRLNEMARASLEDLKGSGLFRPDYLDRHISKLADSSNANGDGVVWDLMVLSMWLGSKDALILAH